MELAFLTIADENYAHCLEINIGLIRRHNPEALIFIIDWGLLDSNKYKLDKNIKILKIKKTKTKIKTKVFVFLNILYHFMKYKIYKPGNFLNVFFKNTLLKRVTFELKLHDKVNALTNVLRLNKDKNFIFIDADAIPIKKLENFEFNFDLALCLRPEAERKTDYNNHQTINVGVLFLKNTPLLRSYINEWFLRSLSEYEYCREQTCLSKMFIESGVDFCKEINNLKYKDKNLCLKFLDPNIYNFNWIENITNRNDAKDIVFLHFKGDRHNKNTMYSEMLRLEKINVI